MSHELVSQSNLKAYNFCGKAQNRLANQQETRTWISFVFENSRVLLFPTFVSFHRFLIRFQFSFTHIVRQKLFLVFSFEILRGKSARGWPELISSCMPDVETPCLSHPAPLPWKLLPREMKRGETGNDFGSLVDLRIVKITINNQNTTGEVRDFPQNSSGKFQKVNWTCLVIRFENSLSLVRNRH